MKTRIIGTLIASLALVSACPAWADDASEAAGEVKDAGAEIVRENPLAAPVRPIIEREFIQPATDAVNQGSGDSSPEN